VKYELAPIKVEIAENGILIEVSNDSLGDPRNHVFTDVKLADEFLEQYFRQQRKKLATTFCKILQRSEGSVSYKL